MGFAFSSDDHDSQQNNYNNGSSPFDVHRAPEDSEYDWIPRLYYTANAVIEGDLGHLLQNPHSPYNQYVAFNLENATMVDGVLYKRDQSHKQNPDTEKYKMFSFDEVGYSELSGSEDPDFDMLNPRWVEKFGENKLQYDLVGASVAQDKLGNETISTNEEDLTLDNIRIRSGVSKRSYQDNGETVEYTGPTSVSKRIVRLLSEGGNGDLVENNFEETHGWASENVQTAEELLGRRVRVWISRESFETDDGNVIDYQNFNALDVETGQTLGVRNNNEPESFDEVMSDDDTEESEDETEEVEDFGPQWSDNMVDAMGWAAEETDGNEDAIMAAINEGVKHEFIDEDEVEGRTDEIVSAVQSGNF